MDQIKKNIFNTDDVQHIHYVNNRSEGFSLMGYVVPGCVEDGAWMLWENSSVAVAVAVVVVAHPGLGRGQLSVLLRLRRFRDARIDPSRLPSTDGPNFTESCRRTNSNLKKELEKDQKRPTIGIA